MDTHVPDTVTLKLSPEVAQRLEEMAQAQQRSLIDIAQETFESAVLNSDVEDDEELEGTPNEEILADLKQSLREFQTGQTRPIKELFDEVRESRKHDS